MWWKVERMLLNSLITQAILAVSCTASPILSSMAAQPNTRNRITFQSSGIEIVGYHHTPANVDKPAPVVILAHGLGGLQTSRLQPFAEQFAAAGYNAITFDYRYWGESAGTPRNLIDVSSQQDDYTAAIAAARKLPGVDPRKVVLWGTSLSGGHVLVLGAKTPDLAGVIAQAPHVNGPRTVAALPFASIPALTAAGIKDLGNAALGRDPLYVPIANATGQWGALTQAGSVEGYAFVQPQSPPPGNVLAARFIIQMPFFSPDYSAYRSKVPTFIGVANDDTVTPPEPAIALAERMSATLARFPGGHFDVYPGAAQYDAMLKEQLNFLQKTVPL